MRDRLRQHFPTVAAFVVALAVAASVSLLAGTPSGLAYAGGPVTPRLPLDLPGPGQDADGDSYADAVDIHDGNLLLAIDLLELDGPSDAHPYVLVGTQDDHGRTGAGAELEWPHVVDHDPLGRRAGSPGWTSDALRTGAWASTLPGEGQSRAVAETGRLADGAPGGAAWPQTLTIDVRDDRPRPRLDLEAWDADPDPDRLLGSWSLVADLDGGSWSEAGAAAPSSTPLGNASRLAGDGAALRLAVRALTGPDDAMRQAIADRWAPTVRFAVGERFFPVPGEALQRFHGFYAQAPDLRTWDLGFNNGRDTYRLLLADFDGDRVVDHDDAAILTDVLAAGELGRPTVYANVRLAGGGEVVVQYWFLYFYGYVLGEDDRGIPALAHAGDRELVQLRFDGVGAALNGTPSSAVFGHHYDGLRITDPAGLGIDGPGWPVYVARGSHATYPAPGDDRRVRPALVGYADVFDGQGPTWQPGNYTVELLGSQPFHAGTLWGPMTRYSRDLGTSARPLLNHDFRYPFADPLFWEAGMATATADEARALFEVRP
jgi:hypothetical protein